MADYFYNDRWGYYNLASIHFDINECGSWAFFGRSEEAEEVLAAIFEAEVGQGTVREDALWFRNFQRTERDGDHFWENNGYATKLRMPAYEGQVIS